VREFADCDFAGVSMAQSLHDALDVDVRKVGLVAVQELSHIYAVQEADVAAVDQAEQLVGFIVVAQGEFVQKFAHRQGVAQFLLEQEEHLLVALGVDGAVVHADVEAAAHFRVGLGEQVLLETVEGDESGGLLVDGALQQAGFLERDGFEVRGEEFLQVAGVDAAPAQLVDAVEHVFNGDVSVCGQPDAVLFSFEVCIRQS